MKENELTTFNPINGVEVNASNISAFIFVDKVKTRLTNIAIEFVEIGKELKLAQEEKLYAKLGYKDLGTLTEELFKIKKSTAYNLIKVFETCTDGRTLLPEFNGFGQTQLTELISIKTAPEKFKEIITPEDSSKKIKKAKALLKDVDEETLINDSEIKTLDDFIQKYSSRLEKSAENTSENNELKAKLEVLKELKSFIEQNNCVCFLTKNPKQKSKNTNFFQKFETFLGVN